jgi:hypothetical protein
MSKETSYSVKRDLVQYQKRPITVSKETSYSVKRDLVQCQKRPSTVCCAYRPTFIHSLLVNKPSSSSSPPPPTFLLLLLLLLHDKRRCNPTQLFRCQYISNPPPARHPPPLVLRTPPPRAPLALCQKASVVCCLEGLESGNKTLRVARAPAGNRTQKTQGKGNGKGNGKGKD